MKSIFGQKLVEVVSRHAARDTGKFLPNQVGVAVANAREAGIDRSLTAACVDELLQLVGSGAAHGHAGAVVQHDIERLDIVGHFAAQQPVYAAAVVADHAAEGAARVRRRIGGVGEVILFRCFAQAVQHNAWLDCREFRGCIDRAECVHVTRKIEDYGDVGALACEAGACSTRQHGCAQCPAGGERGFDVGFVGRVNDADGKLAIIRGIGGVESTRSPVE